MKRSENQSLYKALPKQYISYELSPIERKQFSRDSAVIKIAFWNKTDITPNEIYPPKIVDQVCSNLSDFLDAQNTEVDIDPPIRNLITAGHRGGKTRVRFVQAKINDSDYEKDQPQIYGNINPKMFYCEKCGKIKILKQNSDIKDMYCHNRRMKQYLRVWICSCGESLPIDNYDIKEGDRYFASNQNGVISKDNSTRYLERFCPNCKNRMTLENATDNKTFYPRTITTIKLYNNNLAKLCESEEGCQLILRKHKHEISEPDFNEESNRILQRLDSINTEEPTDEPNENDILNKLLGDISIMKPENPEPVDKEVVYKVLEYDTLVEKKITDLDGAIQKAIKLNKIPNETPVRNLINHMKIKDMYSVSDIEIINTAYGYTRKYQSPESIRNANEKLMLRAFTEKTRPGVPIFYNVRNKTEGIVIDIDPKEMYRHLEKKFKETFRFKNLKDEHEIADWFLDKNNVDPNLIKTFQSIEQNGAHQNEITKEVYNILHTISHLAIKSISKYSGIDKNSLTEMVFPNLCSVLIYASTNQAIVLGAITSMFDKQIEELLTSINEDNKTCSFDPVCINDNKSSGSCIACTLLSEVACEHFNKDLGRRYLYGYHKGNKNIEGFWEDHSYGNNASE